MPQSTVHHGDASEWLRVSGRLDVASVFTSLPDDGVAVFFQRDAWQRGAWIDKGALVTRAADTAGMSMAFHKIVAVGIDTWARIFRPARALRIERPT